MRITATLILNKDKECKNSHRYFPAKGTKDPPVSSMYILKSALPEGRQPPAVLHLTLDSD